MDRHRLVADLVQDRAEPRVVHVGQRDDHDVHRPAGQHRPDLLDAAQPRQREPLALPLVAEQTEQADTGVRPPAEDAEDLGGRLAATDQHRVALVVAVAAGDAQGLAEHGARETGAHDRHGPERRDDHPRVLVGAEGEGHERDEDEHAQRRGLGVVPLRHRDPAEGQPPHDQDWQQLQRVVAEGRDVAVAEHVESEGVGADPAEDQQREVGHEHQLLEESRVRPQHVRPACRWRRRPSTYSRIRRAKIGRSKRAARARSAAGSKR